MDKCSSCCGKGEMLLLSFLAKLRPKCERNAYNKEIHDDVMGWEN